MRANCDAQECRSATCSEGSLPWAAALSSWVRQSPKVPTWESHTLLDSKQILTVCQRPPTCNTRSPQLEHQPFILLTRSVVTSWTVKLLGTSHATLPSCSPATPPATLLLASRAMVSLCAYSTQLPYDFLSKCLEVSLVIITTQESSGGKILCCCTMKRKWVYGDILGRAASCLAPVGGRREGSRCSTAEPDRSPQAANGLGAPAARKRGLSCCPELHVWPCPWGRFSAVAAATGWGPSSKLPCGRPTTWEPFPAVAYPAAARCLCACLLCFPRPKCMHSDRCHRQPPKGLSSKRVLLAVTFTVRF